MMSAEAQLQRLLATDGSPTLQAFSPEGGLPACAEAGLCSIKLEEPAVDGNHYAYYDQSPLPI